jgi:hypothetical protein
MVEAAASVRQASYLRPSALLLLQYDTETPLYRNSPCPLVVGDTGKVRFSGIILQNNNVLIDV